MEFDKIILSLGAGVQSSTMALMAARGLIQPMPDAAIFADTGSEPPWTYQYLDWLETMLPFPVYRAKKGNLMQDVLNSAWDQRFQDFVFQVVPLQIKGAARFAGMPLHTLGRSGKGGMLRRQCTREYKLEPIIRKTREILGLKKGQRAAGRVRVQSWVGISTDEASRMKPNWESWIKNRWPLIELGFSRKDCLEWIRANGFPVPEKSSCIICPYHDQKTWRDIKRNHPEVFKECVSFDYTIRKGVRGTNDRMFLHSSLKPLDKVDFDSLEDKGQLNLFENECEGLCGN